MLPRNFARQVMLGFLVLCVKSSMVKPAVPHTCYQCSDGDCEDPMIAECKAVKENDRCFIRFAVSSNDIIQLGCLSDFIKEDAVQELITNKTLYVCNGVNCNDFAKLPNQNQCIKCSSSMEESCATKPTTVTKQQLCNNIPYTECYQRVKSEVTERGCLYDLEGDEFYECLSGNNDKCQICHDKLCNTDIIPNDRKRCHRCSSETDSNCQSSPAALSVCPSYNATDVCTAVYENGTTKRGCKSEFVCESNSKNCQICLKDGCNTANIKRRFNEPYGIFQDLPINCNTCEGDDCLLGKPLYPNKCLDDDYQDCMTVFDADRKVIQRGCENQVMTEQQTHCDSHPELCFKCKANGCNNITDPSTFQECFFCDAATNPDCLLNPNATTETRKCHLGCVSSLYPRKSNPKVLDFVRMCLDDIEHDNLEFCTVENSCIKCFGNKCNTDILPTDGRISCFHCEGSDCHTPTPKPCLGYKPTDMCYMYFDNVTLSPVRMGCRSDVDDNQLRKEIKQFYICDGDNCNHFKNLSEPTNCIACDSGVDVNCATAPLNVVTQERCASLPYTQCFTRIRDDGHTERGCLSNLTTDIFISCHDGLPTSLCAVCTDNNCNGYIYPASRQWCYHCNSSTDADCETEPSTMQACPIYVPQDTCVTQWVNGITRRGCASEITCEGLNYKNCRKCSPNGCNDVNLASEDIGDLGLFTKLPLRCHQCNSISECQDLNATANVCTGNINQSCTTVVNQYGKVVARGCNDSLENVCSKEQFTCFNCKSNACNIARSVHDYIDCVHCDAKNDGNCTFNVNNVKRIRACYKSCMTALYPRTDDKQPVYELLRSCLDDKDLDDRNQCNAFNAMCKSCTGDNCNIDVLGSRKSCYHCNGVNDCKIPKPEICRAVMDNDQCFLQFDESGSLVEMGCKSKYDPVEVELLVKKKNLLLCDDDNCNVPENTPEPQICVICDSRINVSCATQPAALSSANTTCAQAPYTQCFSRVTSQGHTERGCLSNLEGDEFLDCLRNKDNNCLTCTGHMCNQKMYPNNRLSCHVCSSISSAECEYNPKDTQICPLYTPYDKCVTTIDVNGNTERGCNSTLKCSSSNFTICQECDGNDCNLVHLKRKADGTPGKWQSLPLTCLSCNGLNECSAAPSEQVCTGSEYCMTVFDTSGEVIERGCSNDVEEHKGTYCDMNSKSCLNCNSNLCNRAANSKTLNDCIYCDSKTNPNCVRNPASVKYLRKCNGACMTALYPTENYSYELIRTCLDDREKVDQIACSNSSSNECESCFSSACNTHKLPEQRLSCYHCQNGNCQNAKPLECSRYKHDDQCFIQFNLSDIVRMGCISDLGDEFVSNNPDKLFICNSGDNCNDYEHIPAPTFCTVCNSYTDEACATNPWNVSKVEKCSILPITQCFTKTNEDGLTQRGCVSSLPQDELRACLEGTNVECSVCEKDNCNVNIFPADRRSCQRCNTKDQPDCESLPKFASICPIHSEGQFCATKLVNGYTYRGCSTEFVCDDYDKQYCRLCYGSDNCNFIDLAGSNIGYPGNWQDVPINCYTCKNEECNVQAPIKNCQYDKNENCVTVFSPNGTVVQRGCSDLIYTGQYSKYCDENPGYCKFCKSNGCNMAKDIEEFRDCLYCEGPNNNDCVFHPENIKRRRSCRKGCMTGLYPRNDESNPAYELARGCWDDLELDDREDCETGQKPYCQVCYGTSCNSVRVPQNRLKCNMCHDADCVEPKSAGCTAFRENDQCFTLFDRENNVIRMGCASDLDNSTFFPLARQLLFCSGDNCNTFDSFPTATSCRFCDSLHSPECASNPAISKAETCHRLPHTECYTHVDKDGVTYRGCLSHVPYDLFAECFSGNSSSCTICNTDNCNSEIFPNGRRSCIQCDSSIFPVCEDNANDFASTCALYNENESCVSKLEGNHTIRGCSSEVSCGASSSDTCRICSKTDNCNTINLQSSFIGEPGIWQSLPLLCYHCQGKECSDGNSTLTKCKGKELQTCMTVFNAEGTVIQRGCSDAVFSTSSDYCDENADKCFRCKSNNCNNAKSLDDYVDCYFCDSSENSNCFANFDTSRSMMRKCQTSCMVTLYLKTNQTYELMRTCLDDMNIEDRENCAKGHMDFCKACNSSGCNTMDLPDKRVECYKCLDDGCEDMGPQKCSYDLNEQCYVLFNNESSIVRMGCRSEFETDVADNLLKKKQLLLCNGSRCNAPESLPTPKMCSVCNSAENPLCATNPNLVDNIKRCSSLPYTECFTRINSFGHTERGCLASLNEDDFYGCFMNTSGLCETCVGDKCNEIDVYPNYRRKCHHCSSAADPKCTSTPNSNKVCELYVENDYCVTNYHNGVTTRGCKSGLKCGGGKETPTCRVCETNGCNNENIESILSSGFPGRWQDTPITCFTCQDKEECSSKGYLRPCTTAFQNCMTVFNLEGNVVQRGCSKPVEKDKQSYCDKNPNNCLRCNSNGCNEASSLNQYVQCLYCDTDDNGDCVSNVSGISTTRQCYKYCMTALYTRFEEEKPSYALSRSCYDDMDFDDRQLCAAENKEHCKVCNTSNCNAIDMPKNRHSCYICEGDKCEDPKTQICPTYRSDDKCYIQFDERNQVLASGCLSQYSNEEANYLFSKKRLYICDVENCNTINNIPKAGTCTVCDSRTDIQCAVNPAAVLAETECVIKPFTSCYSRVLADGSTQRGCLSDLVDDELLGCLNVTSSTCQLCNGKYCNKDIYPQRRLTCHICTSKSDPNCEATPKSLSICPKYDLEDTCVTVLRDNVTYRDCSSSLECDDTNIEVCKKCSGNGCNTVNLAKKADEDFGMWQKLPLNCLNCSENNCNAQETTQSMTCTSNDNQDCMTVFDFNGTVTARGCSDSLESKYCSGNENKCYKCKSNNCNRASSMSDYAECIYCNSNNDPDCVWNPTSDLHKTRKCVGGCMSALFPSFNESYGLIRTCLNDKELTDQKTCSKGLDRNCSACSGPKCNTNDIPENRLTCFTCRGNDCEAPEKKLCPVHKENDLCYIRFDKRNSVSEMGCISSLRDQHLGKIIETKRVRVCSGPNCNSLDELPSTQLCADCFSESDESCAVNPNEISSFRSCNELPYTSCYTALTEYGTTRRGCVADLEADLFAGCVLGNDKNCSICHESGCNREIFPKERQQCYTCTSTEEPNCHSYPTSKRPCPYVKDTESCVSALSGNVTVRGCGSVVKCDTNDSNTCRACFGSECNSIDLLNKIDDGYHGVWQELPLKCYTCEGTSCLHSLGPTVFCSSRNIDQDCMVVFDKQGRVERRGCSDDVEDYKDLYCRQNPDHCFRCKSNECNKAWSREEFVNCIFCNSATDPSCIFNSNDSVSKSRKCYKNCMVAMKSGQVIRSCLDDKEAIEQEHCQQSDSEECATCLEDSCNNFIFPYNWLSCHVCVDSSCASSVSHFCPFYQKDDFCFAKYENGSEHILGCASSQNVSDIAEWAAQNKLYKCTGNNCNELSLLPQKTNCLWCDSNKTLNCAQNPTEIKTTVTCAAPNNKCVSLIDVQGNTIRGCSSSLVTNEQSCDSLGTCLLCTEEKCNDQIHPANRRKCHICNSHADKNCRETPSSLKVCPVYDALDKCVSAIGTDGSLQRGCASQIQCANNGSNYCDLCDESGCNTVILKGSANAATYSLLLTLLSVLTVLFAEVFGKYIH